MMLSMIKALLTLWSTSMAYLWCCYSTLISLSVLYKVTVVHVRYTPLYKGVYPYYEWFCGSDMSIYGIMCSTVYIWSYQFANVWYTLTKPLYKLCNVVFGALPS